jgi:branched-chain amino acid aminotransferase
MRGTDSQFEEAIMGSPRFAFFEGEIVPIERAKISVMTHALHYGTAAFAGMRGYWNAEQGQLYIFRPCDHFRRFKHSAELIMSELAYSPEQLLDIVLQLLHKEGYEEDVYIRPLIYKAYQGIGVRLHDMPSELTIFALPFGSYLGHEEGLSLTVSSWRRIDDNAIPPRGKISGAYVNSALIKTEATLDGYDDALVLDQNGHIGEACAANFFLIRNGKAITPPVYENILEGITRQTCWTLLSEELHIEVEERPIDRTEVYCADEAFLCGTAVQVGAITSVDHHKVGSGEMGPIVRCLRELFFDIVRGRNPKYSHWLYPVYQAEAALPH